jgi:predicted RNA-binding protein associated with RNAse of E/G family
MFSGATGTFKGWYCNITRPARLSATEIWADDLALDVFVHPNGEQLVLDEDEFAELGLDEAEQTQARRALAELQQQAKEQQGPFAHNEVERFMARA